MGNLKQSINRIFNLCNLNCNLNHIFIFQGVGGEPCNIYWHCSLQNHCHLYFVPNSLFTFVLWHNMDSNSWGPFPTIDYASYPGETICAPQVFQRSSSSRLGCCRIRGSSCHCLQHDSWRKLSKPFLHFCYIAPAFYQIYNGFWTKRVLASQCN